MDEKGDIAMYNSVSRANADKLTWKTLLLFTIFSYKKNYAGKKNQ